VRYERMVKLMSESVPARSGQEVVFTHPEDPDFVFAIRMDRFGNPDLGLLNSHMREFLEGSCGHPDDVPDEPRDVSDDPRLSAVLGRARSAMKARAR